MSFNDETEFIGESLLTQENLEKVYVSDIVNRGCCENGQFLRKYKNGTWELELRAGFVKFKIPLQEHQAQVILNSNSDHAFECAVIKHESDRFNFT